MKKINAWTLAEMLIAITVLIVLSCAAMSILKPNTQKMKIFTYASIKNIERANSAIMDKYDELNHDNVGGKDWYCTQLADLFSLKGEANCTSATNSTAVNMTFANDVDLLGIANEWKTPYTDAGFKIKDIAIDINGSKGPNSVWVDRFPLRVYTGDLYTGLVRPVNCNNQIYNPDTGAVVTLSTSHPFCNSRNYLTDDSVITYDIVKAQTEGVQDEEGVSIARAVTIRSSLPVLTADCYAYGGIGTYPRAQCAAAGYRLLEECIHPDSCHLCNAGGINTCPKSYSTDTACENRSKEVNPDELPCSIVLHQPAAGISGMLGDLMGDIDM